MISFFSAIIAFWNTSIVVLETRKEKWYIILFLTVFIPVFLLVFQPFGVNNYDPSHRIGASFLFASIGFGIINGVVLALYEFGITPFLFKKSTRAGLALRLFLLVILLSSATYLFYNVLGHFHDWKWVSYFGFIRDIALMSILPLSLIFLYFNYRNTKEAYEILLQQPQTPTLQKSLIELTSDNGKDSISIPADALLYIEAQDNYVSIFHLMQDQVKEQLLRTTMKTLGTELKDTGVLRCHRSYFVNINRVIKAKGNGHQMKLYLSEITSPIPVSRSYLPSLKEIMATHHR